jgi:uncharacterized protein YbaA (DUF1428 family)
VVLNNRREVRSLVRNVTDEPLTREQRIGSSGVFKIIVEGARAVKRALSENEATLSPVHVEIGNEIGRCFVASRFADLHALAAPVLKEHTTAERFVSSWKDAVVNAGPFTTFDVADAGEIELGFVPSLEEVPQSQFAAFLEITFSNPHLENAFSVGAVLLDEGGVVRVGALHAR